LAAALTHSSAFRADPKEEQALTAETAYTGVFSTGLEVQIGLLRWYDPNLHRWINRDQIGQGCIKPVKPGNCSKESMRFVGTFLLN
jgi:hypothetical protein